MSTKVRKTKNVAAGKKNQGLKRKIENKKPNLKGKKKAASKNEDLDISSESGYSDVEEKEVLSESEDEETVQEKRLRLAKQYLQEIEEEELRRNEAKEIDKEIISQRLKTDVLRETGRLFLAVADKYEAPVKENVKVLRDHRLSVTCLCISPDNKFAFSGSKDSCLIKWLLETQKKLKCIKGRPKGAPESVVGHGGHIFAVAISSDGKFLASGGTCKSIFIWNPETLDLIHTFKGHRDAVSGLTIRKNSHDLYSSSFDRSLKVWNLDEMAYVETLFGHQDCVVDIHCLTKERPVTCGGRDSSLRMWKIVDESQLVFQGHGGSIDCVRLIDEQHFLSGGDDGSLALWGMLKKKPLCVIPKVHGFNDTNRECHWITAIAVLPGTDLVATGSHNDFIKFWKCKDDFKALEPLFEIAVEGFVNSLEFTSCGTKLIAAIGQEHKLGRWWSEKKAKNSLLIISLKKND